MSPFDSRRKMVSVFCALVNDGSVFAVDIDARQTVNNLKVLIKECLELRCPAHSLALYLTKHVDGHGKDAWLDSSHEDVAKLETGEIAQTIAALMVNKMDLAYGINDYFDERTPEKKVIHVLVVMPQLRQTSTLVLRMTTARHRIG